MLALPGLVDAHMHTGIYPRWLKMPCPRVGPPLREAWLRASVTFAPDSTTSSEAAPTPSSFRRCWRFQAVGSMSTMPTSSRRWTEPRSPKAQARSVLEPYCRTDLLESSASVRSAQQGRSGGRLRRRYRPVRSAAAVHGACSRISLRSGLHAVCRHGAERESRGHVPARTSDLCRGQVDRTTTRSVPAPALLKQADFLLLQPITGLVFASERPLPPNQRMR